MTPVNRRDMCGGIVLAGSVLAVEQAAAQNKPILKLTDIKKEADVACLYHCDFGDQARFEQMLTNIANHYSVYGANPFDLQLTIVTHGAGVKFFLESLDGTPWKDETITPQLADRIAAQAKNGLKVYLCDITFQRLKLNRNKVRKVDFVEFVPSGVATVAALQSRGFAYLKVG
jgi:intracellular sulfur oxidation DsrE/DsrF family protein